MEHLRAVLRSLRVAGLTANPRKCAIGRVEVRYLGFHLGHGQVRPQIDKTAAVAACPSPKTKKEVRQFLGLAGYYRRFVPNFSDLTSPLMLYVQPVLYLSRKLSKRETRYSTVEKECLAIRWAVLTLATTSWVGNSPSARTTRPSSGSTA